MTEGFFSYERKKIKKLLYVHITILLLLAFIFCAGACLRYFTGYFAAKYYFIFATIFMALVMAFFPSLLLAGLTYTIAPLFLGLKYYLPSLSFFMISVLLLYGLLRLPPKGLLEKGYYDYAKNNANIKDIQKWLADCKMTEYDKIDPNGLDKGRVCEIDWPECIKALNPHYVYLLEKDSKKWVKLIYRFGIDTSFGLCLAEKGTVSNIDEYHDFDHIIPIQDSGFVWLDID